MSRIIEVSNTVIKQPELLPKAIEFLNDLKKYGVVDASYQSDKDGRILGGYFHLKAEDQRYGRGHIYLRYEGKGQPVYDVNGILASGHFRLMGDEDFQENKRLGTLISDHYNAQVIRNHMESMGQTTSIEVAEDGSIAVDIDDQMVAAGCSY
jgi:hypothetical protein